MGALDQRQIPDQTLLPLTVELWVEPLSLEVEEELHSTMIAEEVGDLHMVIQITVQQTVQAFAT